MGGSLNVCGGGGGGGWGESWDVDSKFSFSVKVRSLAIIRYNLTTMKMKPIFHKDCEV